MSQHRVAVIIPCYNSSKFIRDTIHSVLGQTFGDLEIVAVDDGSSDGTRTILESYLPRIRVLSHPNHANLGEGASLNLGINATESDLVAFLDADDIWYPDKVKKQVEIFQKYPDVGLVYTNVHAIDEKGNILYEFFPQDFRERNIAGGILLKCYIGTSSSVMVKREIFEEIGPFKPHLYSTDHDMWIRIGEVRKFYYIANFLTAYRKHGGQKSLERRMWEDGFEILDEACKRYPYGAHLRRRRLGILYYRLAEHDWRHNDYFQGLKNYLLAGISDPIRALQVILARE